jgi:hypothetical protein
MGVDFATWIQVVRAHPAKYKYEGLSGYHTSVIKALKQDERFCNNLFEDVVEREIEYRKDLAKSGDWENLEWIIERLRRDNDDTNDDGETMTDAEIWDAYADDDLGDIVWEAESYDWNIDYHLDESEEEYYIKEYPPVEMLNNAGGYGVDLDDVVFICPSCHHEPATLDDIDISNGYFYCGWCGGSAAVGEQYQGHMQLYILRDLIVDTIGVLKSDMSERLYGYFGLHGYEVDTRNLRGAFIEFVHDNYKSDERSLLLTAIMNYDFDALVTKITLQNEFDKSLFAFFESLEIDLYPFCEKKRRELLEQAKKYGPVCEIPRYWHEQMDTVSADMHKEVA